MGGGEVDAKAGYPRAKEQTDQHMSAFVQKGVCQEDK
jgi:hypothetical protein